MVSSSISFSYLKPRQTVQFTKKIRPNNLRNPKKPKKEADLGHAILEVFEAEQLSRNMFLLSVPLSVGLLAFYSPAGSSIIMPWQGVIAIAAVSIGAAATWSGLLLKKVVPRISTVLELGGVSLLLFVFFGFLASHLPRILLCVPILSYFMCLVTIVAAASIHFRAPVNFDMV